MTGIFLIIEVAHTLAYLILALIAFVAVSVLHCKYKYTEHGEFTEYLKFISYTVLVFLTGYFYQFM